MIPLHTPGPLWDAHRDGVIIPTAHDLGLRYEDTGFSRWCAFVGIPTGRPIPVEAVDLAVAAYQLQPRDVGMSESATTAEHLALMRAAAVERDERRLGMIDRVLALCAPMAQAAE